MSRVFSIPEPWRGDRKRTTRWIKIISNHKPWEILFITYIPTHTIFSFIIFFVLYVAAQQFARRHIVNKQGKVDVYL
jgi:hypothetical protein